jgi:hypothetical protein
MNIRPIVLGMVVCLMIPLAGATAGSAGDNLGPGVAPTAENFWLSEPDCDKSPSDYHECKHRKCDKNDESHNRMTHDKDGEWKDHEGRCDRDDNHRWCDAKDHDSKHLKHDKDGSWEDHNGKCDTW